MKIIPVLDLKAGLVVHARCGHRDLYQPINTPLCASANAFEVVDAFLALYGFDTFYIADLDAITGRGNQQPLIDELLRHYPNIQFWIDRGLQLYQTLPANHLPVLGSECYSTFQLPELAKFNNRFVLSLDYANDTALGAVELFTDNRYWPDTVIIMTLAQVGSQRGADMDKLRAFCQAHPGKRFVAAGGIRDIGDLLALQAIGIHYALVATALHSGAIKHEDIAKLWAKKYPD